jgi:hypothetical protein
MKRLLSGGIAGVLLAAVSVPSAGQAGTDTSLSTVVVS